MTTHRTNNLTNIYNILHKAIDIDRIIRYTMWRTKITYQRNATMRHPDDVTKQTTQYEIRTIDEYGDVIDIDSVDGSGSKQACTKLFNQSECEGDAVAIAMEKVTIWGCQSEGIEELDYEEVYTKGSAIALDHWRGVTVHKDCE